MGGMRGDVVGEGDIVVGGDAIGGIVMQGDILGGVTSWEETHHGRKEVTREDIIGGGDAVVGGGDAIGGEMLLEETSWEESCHETRPCEAVLVV